MHKRKELSSSEKSKPIEKIVSDEEKKTLARLERLELSKKQGHKVLEWSKKSETNKKELMKEIYNIELLRNELKSVGGYTAKRMQEKFGIKLY